MFAEAAAAQRDQNGAAEASTSTADGIAETPTTARARLVRQGGTPSAGGPAPSPCFAADGSFLRSYNLK